MPRNPDNKRLLKLTVLSWFKNISLLSCSTVLIFLGQFSSILQAHAGDSIPGKGIHFLSFFFQIKKVNSVSFITPFQQVDTIIPPNKVRDFRSPLPKANGYPWKSNVLFRGNMKAPFQ
jgi:hypothetical protein